MVGLPGSRESSPQLLAGLDGLEGLEGFEREGEVAWRWKERVWVFPCRLTVPPTPEGLVPTVTRWWVIVDAAYPAGPVELFPAKDGGLTRTFPHQSHNQPGPENVPWRTGNLCLHVNIESLRRYGPDTAPRTADSRLRWNIERARYWLIAAGRGELVAEGEPFELPDFRFGEAGRLAFVEDRSSLSRWDRSSVLSGYFETRRVNEVLVATRFLDQGGRVVHAPAWGRAVEGGEKGPLGVWVRLDRVPVVEPWEAPTSWKDLDNRCREFGVDLEEELLELAQRKLRASGRKRTDRPRHPLLIGFPIPERFGRPSLRMHWIGFTLPPLTDMSDSVPGFRTTTQSMADHDRKELRSLRKLPWFRSESWSDDELTGRGRLPEALRTANVLLLGAGTLGSMVAEMLVRGGVRKLTVVDPEALEAGNLVRHTLGMKDVGKNKAEALAERLNQIAPEVDVLGLASTFPDIPTRYIERAKSADLVIDATASDPVLVRLEDLDWPGDRTFVSLSMGLGCRRLYLFAVRGAKLPRSHYMKAVAPWLEDDWKDVDERELPREGVGCWQPLMPGTAFEVMLLAAAGISVLSEMIAGGGPTEEPRFVVLEQQREQGRFAGVRRLGGSVGPAGET